MLNAGQRRTVNQEAPPTSQPINGALGASGIGLPHLPGYVSSLRVEKNVATFGRPGYFENEGIKNLFGGTTYDPLQPGLDFNQAFTNWQGSQ